MAEDRRPLLTHPRLFDFLPLSFFGWRLVRPSIRLFVCFDLAVLLGKACAHGSCFSFSGSEVILLAHSSESGVYSEFPG